MLFKRLQKICQLKVGNIFSRDVFATGLNERLGKVLFEALQIHDFVFDGVTHDHPVHVHCTNLAYPVSSIHRLQIFHRVPVMLHENDDICTSESESKTTDSCGENQYPHWLIMIELVDNLNALTGAVRT